MELGWGPTLPGFGPSVLTPLLITMPGFSPPPKWILIKRDCYHGSIWHTELLAPLAKEYFKRVLPVILFFFFRLQSSSIWGAMLEDNVDFGLRNKNASSIIQEPQCLLPVLSSWWNVSSTLGSNGQCTHRAAQLSPLHPIGNETEPTGLVRAGTYFKSMKCVIMRGSSCVAING